MRVGIKGKGNRRRPGRDGGRRGSKAVAGAWRKRVSHAVDLLELREPKRPKLGFPARFRESLESAAYRMDQVFAKESIPYSVDVPHGAEYFDIQVGAADLERTDALLKRLWLEQTAT